MRYPHTVKVVSERIEDKFPGARMKLEKADRGAYQRGRYEEDDFPSYLLWMLEELQSFEDPAKAGRWLGWALRSAEVLDVLSLDHSRALVRIDVHAGAA